MVELTGCIVNIVGLLCPNIGLCMVYGRYIRQQLLHERHWSPIERLAFLSSVSVEAVEAFVASMKRKMYVQGLIQGNLTEEAARWMEGMLLERIRCSPVPPGVLKEVTQERIHTLF
jgi:secreted Zn-dependent insulinase-like peptidase